MENIYKSSIEYIVSSQEKKEKRKIQDSIE